MNGQRIRLREKNNDNWSLRLASNIFVCSKCKKYNTLLTPLKICFCIFCGNPNIIK